MIDDEMLGNQPDGAPDPDDVDVSDMMPIDDEEIDDRAFDCD